MSEIEGDCSCYLWQEGKHGLDGHDDAAIVKGVDGGLLVEGQHCLHRPAGEEQLLVRHRARQGLPKVRSHALGELNFCPQRRVSGDDVGG